MKATVNRVAGTAAGSRTSVGACLTGHCPHLHHLPTTQMLVLNVK